MKDLALQIMMGAKVPEGFAGAIAQNVSLAGPIGYFSRSIDARYDFWLERIGARWVNQSADTFPLLTLTRDTGQRSFFSQPIDLRCLSNPAEAQTVPVGIQNPGEPLGILFEAGGVIQAQITGYTPSDPASIHIVMFGRFIRAQKGAW